MKARIALALLFAALGVGYVVHAVAFRSAERDGEIAVVATWGQLMAQPAVELPSGDRVRLGLDARTVDRFGAALLYVLWECPAREARTERSLRVERDDGRSIVVAGPTVTRAWLWLSGVTIHVHEAATTVRVVGELGAEWGHASIAVGEAPSPWRPFRRLGLTGQRRVDLVPRHGAPAAPMLLTSALTTAELARPPPDGTRLPPLVPDEPHPWFRASATPSGFDFVMPPGPVGDVEDSLLARFRVGGPSARTTSAEGSNRRHALVNWDFAAIGARPGDRVTVELLWCREGFVGADAWSRAGAWAFQTPGNVRSNAFTIVVPDGS